MATAKDKYLDPSLDSTAVPRPKGARPGEYPLQENAKAIGAWSTASYGRAPRTPFGETVGEPTVFEYDVVAQWMMGVHCLGDPRNPDDRSQVQASNVFPPSVDDAVARWWVDWRRYSVANRWNQSRVNARPPDAYMGLYTKGGEERPMFGFSSFFTSPGILTSSLSDMVLAAPGNATRADLDCPFISDDGTTSDPLPLRVPVWVGRYLFKGFTGQVVSGVTNQHFGNYLTLVPNGVTFSADNANRRAPFSGEFGGEGGTRFAYALTQCVGPFSFYEFTGPGEPCGVHSEARLVGVEFRDAFIHVFVTPFGEDYAVFVMGSRGRRSCELTSPFLGYTEIPAFSRIFRVGVTAEAVELDAGLFTFFVLPGGGSIDETIPLWAEAQLVVEAECSSTGEVTGEARIEPLVGTVNSGPGWRDSFVFVG